MKKLLALCIVVVLLSAVMTVRGSDFVLPDGLAYYKQGTAPADYYDVYNIQPDSDIAPGGQAAIPEPATICLICLGGLMIRRKK